MILDRSHQGLFYTVVVKVGQRSLTLKNMFKPKNGYILPLN